jgi:predicted transglutaminase-like cysteine proteinase
MGRQMGFFGRSRVWRAIMLACGVVWSLAWCGSVSGLKAETLAVAAPDLAVKSTEPFGLSATTLAAGNLHDKWIGLARRLDDDMVQLALCDGDREGCVAPAALRLLAIVDAARLREGRGKLGEINRAINLAIRAMSDEAQYGQSDVWASPLSTFSRGAGDCEDYAIAKFAALRLAGLAADDLRILIVHDAIRGEDHAVTAARLDGRWMTLDNRRMAMVEDADIRNYRPTFVMDRDGIRRYAPAPLLSGVAAPAAEPAALAAPAPPAAKIAAAAAD